MLVLHLKKIEVQGFKSFADKIEIKFEKGITAIVGPNGSGKSNISDAIKWVLGEQSVKSLRGKKMQDIIFAGTDKRKPLSYTEVTITFDNKDGMIPLDYQEVAITRRMFRSGESEYYLNKNSCRLRDIRELFMDTGVGTDGYSIIGQGKVDEILSTRPEDRRAIFEEAAGIVKYKSKKTEAEKKLEKTHDNLDRIKDILFELKKQDKSLEGQAKKANFFMEVSKELKKIEVNLYIREIDSLQEEIEVSSRKIKELQSEIDTSLEEKNHIEANFTSMNIEIESLDKRINGKQDEKIEQLNKLNESKNQLKLLNEKEKYNIRDIMRWENEIEELKIEIKELRNLQAKILEEEKLDRKSLKAMQNNFNGENIALSNFKNDLQIIEKSLEMAKNKNMKKYNEIADKKNKINGIVSFEENISKRVLEIKKTIGTFKAEKENNKKSLKKIKMKKAKYAENTKVNEKLLSDIKSKKEDDENKLDTIITRLNGNKMELQDRISNFNMLKNMEEDYEGYYRSVKNLILASKKNSDLEDKIVGIIADLIKVEERYEKAIDIALGGRLQNIVTENESHAKVLVNYLRKNKLGRATFLPLTTIRGRTVKITSEDRKEYKILGLGSELISYDESYRGIIESLLGRTLIVEDLDQANKVARKFNYSFRIVTLEGDIVNPGGSITGGSMPKVSGNLLNRKHRISKLETEINKLKKDQRKLEEDESIYKAKLKESLKTLDFQEKKINQINIETIKIENEENKYENELERLDNSILGSKSEIGELKLQSEELEKDKEILSRGILKLENKNEDLKESIENQELDFKNKLEIKEDVERKVTDMKIKISLLENQLKNKEEKMDSIKSEVENKLSLKTEKKKELLDGRNEIDGILKKISSLELDTKEFSKLEKKKEESLKLLQGEKKQIMKSYYEEQNRLKEVNLKLSSFEKEKNDWDVKEAKEKLKLENLNMKLLEDYELIYHEAKDLFIEIEDLEEASKKVKKLKKEIKNLGIINLASIEEYKEVSGRLKFIKEQYEDLIDAKLDLQEVIKNMERKMEKQFLASFNEINYNFNEIFTVLFDGGRAELILEDMEDILTCGIEIQAQPPGKKFQNLSLLSGGEKSLAAVALLFSIIKMRPTPFCVLDEIDASLDEANIGRYTNYLKDFSDETQFIMITHRKSTMEMADVLYGVTMEEKGISKMISVKLTDDLDEIAI